MTRVFCSMLSWYIRTARSSLQLLTWNPPPVGSRMEEVRMMQLAEGRVRNMQWHAAHARQHARVSLPRSTFYMVSCFF